MLSRVLCLFSAGLLMAQPAQDPAATARKALDLLLAGKYADLEQMFAPSYKSPTTLENLTKLGAQIKTWGDVESVGNPNVRDMGPVTLIVFPVKFATRNIDVQMSVNASGQVSAPLLRPGEAAWQPPSYVKAGSYHEREVTIGDKWKLPGTLTVPEGAGPFPGVVLVHGSGPNDRDETVGGTKMFKDLAAGLASRGIAVLRYEKRTRVYSAKMAGVSYTADDETIEDAAKAVALMRQQREVDPKKIYLLGHDLGGYLAPRVAEEDGKLAGVILLAASARPIEDILIDEAPANQVAAVKLAAAKVKTLEAADEDAPRILGLPVAYWVDLKGYDAPAMAKKLGIPFLVLYGERDFQVAKKDFDLWKAALSGGKTSAQSYPALNHLFVSGEGKSTEVEYRKPGHVAPEVVDAIAKFVTQ